MGYRNAGGDWVDSCEGKIGSDEPRFLLRGQDRFAAALVDAWANLVEEFGNCPADKIQEARECAAQMRLWHTRKLPD